jgi:hypothetical protein
MRRGIVTRVMANKNGFGLVTEYEVHFGDKVVVRFYQTQLRLLEPNNSDSRDWGVRP